MCQKLKIYLLFFFIACTKKDIPIHKESPVEAKVLISQLRLRITPSTQSAEIDRLEKGEVVKILGRSPEKMRIGKEESYWYEIETKSGIRGWVYGAYLDVEGKSEKEDPNIFIPKMKEYLLGRWYVERAKGGLSDLFITFYPSGQFDCGQGKNVFVKGSYEINPTENNKAIIHFVEPSEKIPVTELFVELRGQTLLVQGKWKEQKVKFQLAEKNPQPFEEISGANP